MNSANPIRNFTLTADERIRAMAAGVPAWAARKRKIEDDVDDYVGELLELHEELVAKKKPDFEIDLALGSAAAAFDLAKLNALVAAHNRYYPIEANLPMDRAGSGYLAYGRPWEPETPYTAQRIVALARAELARRADRDARAEAIEKEDD